MNNPKLSKRLLSRLEKVFSAEIENNLPYQSRSKDFTELQESGLVEHVRVSISGATVEGWVLTHAGRFAYCVSCTDAELPEARP